MYIISNQTKVRIENNSENPLIVYRTLEDISGMVGGKNVFRLPIYSFGRGFHRFIEVSEEFEENVINIAKNDFDVQGLLDDGYNITRVRPIIKAIVEADGNVVTKATSAIVMLEKDTTGRASVWVDMEEAKVTKIVILTRTVIKKP